MPADYTKPPYSFFASPGTVRVSAAALAMARTFADATRRARPDRGWVVTFDWAESRSVRDPRRGGPWVELGAGLDLVAFERRDIPPGVTETNDGLEFAIKIPAQIVAAAILRLIDVDDCAVSKLALR